MNKKKLYLILSTIGALALAAILFAVGFHINASSIAREQLEGEIQALANETEEIRAEKASLEKQIDDIDTELSTKSTVNSYYMEYKKTHDKLTSEVEELRVQSEKLDSEIKTKQNKLDASSLSDIKSGKSYPLTRDKSYSCPEDVPSARYTAKGSGTFTVISSTGKVRLSQNLDTAYEHSYTFNLNEKERIRVTGDVTLTEIK